MSNNYVKKTFDTLKENYISAIIGLIIFLVAFNYITNYISENGSISIKSLIGNSEEAEKESTTASTNKYTVKKGDTLWSISEMKIGSGYNFVDIARVNNIADVNDIEAGEQLIIPDVDPIRPNIGSKANQVSNSVQNKKAAEKSKTIDSDTYTVVKGDSLWNISVRVYGDGYQWPKIARANKLVNPNLIHPGNRFVIPRD
jgi:nucleoid-associated protein YgaU